MRLVIECIERVGVAQDILGLLATQGINLEGIELEKGVEKGLIYLRTEAVSAVMQQKLIAQIKQIAGVTAVQTRHHLPQERKNLELYALVEALPNPVFSLDLNGKITFANSQAVKLLLPIYRQQLPKRKQAEVVSLDNVPLNEVMVNLNRTKWYGAFLAQGLALQAEALQPISHPIQCHDQVWRMDLLPIELWEAEGNRPLGYVVSLQSQQAMQLDLRQFMATQNSEFDQLVMRSPKMKTVVDQAKRFSTLNVPLLIQGEIGTGKDLFAKACHHFGFRRNEKFIPVNCAGLPPEEAESEMFGHCGGERERTGFFEYAQGGTVLLDGIEELSLEMQAKLLRFLNDGSFRRVGEDREIQVDVRVICTSQQPLSALVASGRFREDLYHRLNALTLVLPPLRERMEDLPLLVAHFVQQISQELGIRPPLYDDAFLHALQGYRWPGNLRELHNVLYRACSLSTDQLRVSMLNLPTEVPSEFAVETDDDAPLEVLISRFEASLLRKFYVEYPSTRKLAQRLGISHTAVANKLRQHGIGKL